MIEGLIGRPGSGKSYEATRRVLEAADRDRLVFTNFGVKHPNVYQFRPEELMDLPPGLVVIDEAHLWFPARRALNLPMSWLAGMSQTRKKGWDLLWVAQHEARIDKVVRDVTSWMWLCNAWFSWDGHPLLFTRTSWEPEYFRRPDRRMTRSASLFSRRVAEAYNTFEQLTQAQHTVDKSDVYARSPRATSKSSDAPRADGSRRNPSVLDGVI